MSDVVVLGCGPSGLMAAKAVEDAGHSVSIISRKIKSALGGAMYVHEPVPGLTALAPHSRVTYVKMGTREGYAAKVYGDPKAPCSWDIFPEGEMEAWDMAMVYDKLWKRYEHAIVDTVIDAEALAKMTLRQKVVSTIPQNFVCEGDHVFEHATIWVARRSLMVWPGWHNKPRPTDPWICYNGDPYCGWYRASSLFDHASQEYGHAVPNSSEGVKPTWSSCDCHPDVIRAGRFGEWKKGVLITDAYRRVKEALS